MKSKQISISDMAEIPINAVNFKKSGLWITNDGPQMICANVLDFRGIGYRDAKEIASLFLSKWAEGRDRVGLI